MKRLGGNAQSQQMSRKYQPTSQSEAINISGEIAMQEYMNNHLVANVAATMNFVMLFVRMLFMKRPKSEEKHPPTFTPYSPEQLEDQIHLLHIRV